MRRLLAPLACLAAVGFVVMGGTLASFSDSETSNGNTFTTGTLDLKIAGDEEEFGDGTANNWMLLNIQPGANTPGVDIVTQCVNLKRYGTIAGNHLEIHAELTSITDLPEESDTQPGTTTMVEMAKKLNITSMVYDGDPLVPDDGGGGLLLDADGDTFLTINDITYDPDGLPSNGLDDLVIPSATGVGTSFCMTVKWREGADDNNFQGDTLLVAIRFTLNETASQ